MSSSSDGERVPRVRVVVLNFNGGELVLRCIDHLVKSAWPAEALEIVLVDNASTDGSDRVVEAAHPEVTVMRNHANLGFPGNNVAMRDLARVDYVALINNDAFVEPGWLAPLVAALESDISIAA